MIPKFQNEYVTFEELVKAYIDCRKRKRTTCNALEFEIDDTRKLYKLWIDLNKKEYVIGKSIVFCVDKPVKREVFAADFRDRIVHHLIINRLNDCFEKEFIDDSYSCRVGKGTDYGIRKCEEYIREATDNYSKEKIIVKCDLKSFFMTIDKNNLYNKLKDFITAKYNPKDEKENEFIFYIIRNIIFNEPQNNCIRKQPLSSWDNLPKEKSLFNCDSNKGLPIGNLTSQIFANFYLSEFDHYIKDELKIKYYGRYVDDFFFILDTHEEASKLIKLCRKKLSEMGVTLHPKKVYQQTSSKGVKFIGAVIKPNRIYISNRTKGNFYAALNGYNEELKKIEENGDEPSLNEIEHFVSSINSYLGFLVNYKTFNIRKKILFSRLMDRWKKYCYIDVKLRKITPFEEYTKIRGKKSKISIIDYYSKLLDVFLSGYI